MFDAYLSLARVGDGQCFVPEDFIKFVIMPEKPVAILPLNSRIFLGAHYNLTTNFEELDALCRICNDNIKAHGIYRDISLGGLVVLNRKTFEAYAERSKIEFIGAISIQEHRKFWDSLTPGLWVVTKFGISGLDDCSSESYDLPRNCVIAETREHNIWT